MLWKSIALSRRWLSVPVALLAFGVAGCGEPSKPIGKVDGRVTLDGQPVPEGTVVMFVDGPEPFSGMTGPDGKFVVETAKAGNYAVAIQQVDKDEMSPEERKKMAATGKSLVFQSVIPDKYRNAGTSDIKFEVKEGDNKFEQDLKKGATVPGGMSGGGGKGGKG